MNEHTVIVRTDQLDQISSLMSGPPQKRFTLAQLKTIVEMLAIVVAGAWVLFMFFSYERNSKFIATEILGLERDAKQFQQTLAELETEKLKLANHSASLEARLKQIDVSAKETVHLEYSNELEVNELSEGVYHIVYRVTINNKTHREREITYIAVQFFHGNRINEDKSISIIDGPPGNTLTGGGVKWSDPIGRVYVTTPKLNTFKGQLTEYTVPLKVDCQPEGGTGSLAPEGGAYSGFDIIIRGDPKGWIACKADIGIDDAKKPEDKLRLSTWKPLTSAIKKSSNPSGNQETSNAKTH